MPIILNGTTFNNGGTVTFNGQTVKEVQFNGTTVWKAENVLYPGATVNHLQVNSGDYSIDDFRTRVYSGENRNGTTLYISVDLTDYSTLKVEGTFSTVTRGGYVGCWISSANQFSTREGYIEYGYYTVGPGSSSSNFVAMNRINNTIGSSSGWTFDVSGLSGVHFICINGYYNTSSGGTAMAQVTKISAE